MQTGLFARPFLLNGLLLVGLCPESFNNLLHGSGWLSDRYKPERTLNFFRFHNGDLSRLHKTFAEPPIAVSCAATMSLTLATKSSACAFAEYS